MKLLERPHLNGARVDADPLRTKQRRPRWTWYAIAGAVLIACAALAFVLTRTVFASKVVYSTAPVQATTLVRSITASGTVNPQNTITVGTQDSGTISQIDVDFNSKVRQGQVLAKLDPTSFQAALDQANAALAQAQAQASSAEATAQGAGSGAVAAQDNVQVAAATAAAAKSTVAADAAALASAQGQVGKAQSALTVAQQTVTRDNALVSQGFLAQSQYDTDKSAVVSAQAGVTAAQTAVAQAQAQMNAAQMQAQANAAQTSSQAATGDQAVATQRAQEGTVAADEAAVAAARANVQQAQQNLAKTVITSPVDGTVIARDVSVGQTVAASLQTPTLFSIAQNLGKMEVDVAVGEPDIGAVAAGDAVNFSVLAYPNKQFTGTVSQVRINPTTTNNVVTYDTVVLVNNPGGQLLPGMTANATIATASAKNALVVPTAALQYHPPFTGTHKRSGTPKTGSTAKSTGATTTTASTASPWGQTQSASSTTLTTGSTGRVFVQDANGKLRMVPVTIGLTTQTQAAVTPVSGELSANDNVVIADNSGGTGHATGSARPASPALGAGAARSPLGGVR